MPSLTQEMLRSNLTLARLLSDSFERWETYVDLPSARMLDIGCGPRTGFFFVEQVCAYYGIDPDKEAIRKAKRYSTREKYKNTHFAVARGEAVPFKTQFDIVLYWGSWHFITNHGEALNEAKRVLKPNGIVTIREPCPGTRWWDPRLNRNEPEFDPQLYDKKCKMLQLGEEALKKQNIFRIAEFTHDTGVKYKGLEQKIWILR